MWSVSRTRTYGQISTPDVLESCAQHATLNPHPAAPQPPSPGFGRRLREGSGSAATFSRNPDASGLLATNAEVGNTRLRSREKVQEVGRGTQPGAGGSTATTRQAARLAGRPSSTAWSV